MCYGENPTIMQIVYLLREKDESALQLIHELVRHL
jgi:hypothetical protein